MEDNRNGFEIERLNTQNYENGWEYFDVKCDFKRCC
jgi:hypothetical protein